MGANYIRRELGCDANTAQRIAHEGTCVPAIVRILNEEGYEPHIIETGFCPDDYGPSGYITINGSVPGSGLYFTCIGPDLGDDEVDA